MKKRISCLISSSKVKFALCKTGVVAILLLMANLFFSAGAFGQSPYTSIATGPWNADATWSGTGFPVAGDVVTIANTHNVSVSAAAAACTTLTINDGGTLTLAGFAITVSGTTTVGGGTSGTVTTLTSGAGTKTFTGPVIINANATWNLSGQNPATGFGGGITMNGTTFNNGTGATAFSATQSLLGASPMTFGGIVTIGAGFILTNGNTNTVTLSNAGVALAVGGAGSTFTQGSTGNTLSYAGSSIGVTNFNATGTNNTVNYTATAPTIRAVNYHNLTHSGTGTVTVAGISIAGNLTENSTGTFNLTGTTAFNGTATQTISGTGTFTFANITLNTTGAVNVAVNQSISVSGTIAWSANGLLVVNSSSNITLGTAAVITAPTSTRYIQLDGSTGNNSNLIRTTGNNTTDWQFTFPIGTGSGGYTPLVIPTVATAPANNSTLSVKAIYNGSTIGQLRRTFRLVVSGNGNATTFTNAQFNYSTGTDISSGDVQANYNTIWYLPLSTGVWTTLTGTAPGVTFFTAPTVGQSLQTGTYYYTIGNGTAYPTTWYSYQSGVWSNPDVWTQDPSGTNLINPLTQVPSPGDQVVILNGFTVTSDINTITTGTMEIQGGATLDLSVTTGHNLGTVSGAGLLRINGVNLPSGTFTSFVSASAGGTIEYYNTGGTLPVGQITYNKLIFSNTTGAAITYVTANSLTINSTLNITQTSGGGTVTWQINDASAVQRTIAITGDVTVSANGLIRVGTGNSIATTPHIVALSGNLTNSGSIKFFDATDATYSDANYTSRAVFNSALRGNTAAVTFSGLTNTTVTGNNQTDFYRLILNKGTGQQAILTINSSSTANFRLFGPNNQARSVAAPNTISNNGLSIQNGTLQLTGFINIPSMIEVDIGASNSWTLPQNGALWLNSSNVVVQVAPTDAQDNRHFILYGLVKVTDGTLNLGHSRGLLGGGSGQFVMEGGTVNTWQLRSTNLGTNNNFAYRQTGGTVNVGTSGTGVTINDFPRFALPYTTCTFSMSGGSLNVAEPISVNNGSGAFLGGIMINSASSSTQVTGGTVRVSIPASANNFTITSTAPFYNLTIDKIGAGAATAILNGISAFDGVSTITEAAQPLIVLNNLTLTTGNTPTLDCNSNNLTVGGNFDVQASTTFTPGANTVTFNGSAAQSWTHNGTITSLASVVVNKTVGTTLTLAGANVFPGITTALTLTSGTLADGGKTVTVTGAGILTNNATHTGAGVIDYTGTAASILGTGGTFGNLNITSNATIATAGSQTIAGTLRLINASSTLDIGINALTVSGNIYSNASPGTAVAFTATKRILTNGFHNAGGLTRQGAAGDLLFPVGSSAVGVNPTIPYTPITINVAATTQGTITVRPVNSEHPNVTTTAQGIRYYWRVTGLGYAGVTAVTHKSYDYSTAVEDNPTANYRSARYDRTANTWATNNTVFNATASPPIPNFNTGTGWTGVVGDQLDGEYTCGNIAAFGVVTVFYSRTPVAAPGTWNVNTTWSTVSLGGVAAPAGAVAGVNFPGPNNPVIVGDAVNNHGVVIDQNARSCGSLSIGPLSVVDCSTFTSLNFGTNTSGAVTGTGTLRIAAVGAGVTNMFPSGDFNNFLGVNGGTVEWYGATKTIPATGPAPQNLSLSSYYNLVVNSTGGNTMTLPATNLRIYNNMTQGDKVGFGGAVVTNGTSTIDITGNLAITRGVFRFSNANPSVTTMTLAGSLTVANGASFSVAGGGTANVNTLSLQGGITNDGTINLNNTQQVNLTFTGSNNVTFGGTGSGGTTLNLLTVNKGTSQTPVVDFSVGGTVTTATSGWLTLINGTFQWNNTSTSTISTASASYTIPSTTKLKVSLGTVNILTANNDAADLLLNGALEVSGGTVNIGSAINNTNNDIEYAAAGTPTITVSSGTLFVNGAVRRPTSTLAGALVYNQTNGTVTIAGRNCNIAPNNTRGIFEIENNTGSSFTLSNASQLTITRSTGGASFTDFYLKPVTSSVASTSTVQIGDNALGAQTLSFNSIPTLGNATILGATGNAQTVNMVSSPLLAAATLTINQASTLNTNALDVSIGGDLATNATATYNGAANTTTFNGSAAQAGSLSATSSFFNMTVNKSAGTVSLSGTSPTINNLNILSGILDVGSLALQVNANIVNNSSQIGAGSIVMFGASATHSITSTNGSFTNLTLGGAAASKNVTVTGNLTINGTLNFSASRFLTIGSSLLTFGTGGTITGFGSTAFVRTSGSTGDAGVTKSWGPGISNFTYAIGTINNYTPVFYNLNVSTPGTLNVTPINSRHPTAVGTEQTLNYYWIVTRGALVATMNASHTYAYPSALIGGSGGSIIAGYLDISNPTGWVTSGHGGTATTTTMTYTTAPSTNFPSTGITYHYSVGTTASLPNPIAPVYSRLADASVSNPGVGGNWTSVNSWTTASNGLGAAVGAAPTGIPVTILPGARINTNVNGRSAFTTTINGTVVLGTSFAHSFGTISGTGTLQTSSNVLPSGNYTAFVSSAGGTIEYVGPLTMNNRSTYNNLTLSGAGVVTMTNTDLVLNGSMTIGSGVTLNNSVNNRNISLAGNWTNNGGTFTAGTGTVTFNGTAAQTIGGTASTTFYGLTLNNSFGTAPQITLARNTTSTNALTMTSGIVNLAGFTYTLGASGAASTLSRTASTTTNWMYGGTVCRFWPASTAISSTAGNLYGLYPVGAATASSYRPVAINSTVSPTVTGSYCVTHTDATTTTDLSPVFNDAGTNIVRKHNAQFVASSSGLTDGTYDIAVTMTGLPAGTLSDIRLAVNGAGTTVTNVGTHVAAIGTAPNPTAGRTGVALAGLSGDFRITTTNLVATPLPIELLSFEVVLVGDQVQLKWSTASELNNDFFTIERASDIEKFEKVSIVKGQGTAKSKTNYSFEDESPLPGISYYRLKQTDFDGKFTYSGLRKIEYSISGIRLNVYPNPIVDNKFSLELIGAQPGEEAPVRVVNLQGVSVYNAGFMADGSGKLLTTIELDRAPSGVYMVIVNASTGLRKKVIIP
jgi:fibronectin-binding autotransporter adhesin